LMQQRELRGFAAAVSAFNDKEFAREFVFAVGNHRRRH